MIDWVGRITYIHTCKHQRQTWIHPHYIYTQAHLPLYTLPFGASDGAIAHTSADIYSMDACTTWITCHIYTWKDTWKHTHIDKKIHANRLYTYIYIHTWKHIYIHEHINTHTHTYIYAYIQRYIHTRTHLPLFTLPFGASDSAIIHVMFCLPLCVQRSWCSVLQCVAVCCRVLQCVWGVG